MMSDSPNSTVSAAAMIDRLARIVQSLDYQGGLNPAQWDALRYLERANRFSRNPKAMAAYLQATKGTISQTIKALETKGLVAKSARSGDARALDLNLTTAGHEVLARDPAHRVAEALADLSQADRMQLERSLASLTTTLLTQQQAPLFGVCRFCRHHITGDPSYCGLLKTDLSPDEVQLVCAEHEPA